MSLPLFFIKEYNSAENSIQLDEDTSRHVISVLRMVVGEPIMLTDGKGNILTAEIVDDHRKRCMVKVIDKKYQEKEKRKVTIAVSLLKNANRFEWFIEKATELGISEIIPLICDRTDKQKFKAERIENILVSAMLQSKQCWLPELHDPVRFQEMDFSSFAESQKFIAHCEEAVKNGLNSNIIDRSKSAIILIGPEGDFSPSEIETAVDANFIPVALGETRLRTETAAVAAAVLLRLF